MSTISLASPRQPITRSQTTRRPTSSLAALLVERHPLVIAWPRCLRSRAVELAVLAPIVFAIGFALAAGF